LSIYSLPLHFGKQLTGSQGGETHPQHDIARYLRLHQHGKLKLDQLVGDSLLAVMANGLTSGQAMIPTAALACCMAVLSVKSIGNTTLSADSLRSSMQEQLLQ